ncbi:UDP binding domain-containing protein [Campylobacter hyointestinalis]|uniref:UDP binding domain-containing protein n=1 Tax=Campylobacter hyointestinalis TaxID=198 RepID=UPI0015E1DACB|nr:UDP binding domain-containing protein [Campylobacter hyointestinalis]
MCKLPECINLGDKEYAVTRILKLLLKNCPNIKNSRAIDILNEFRDFGYNVMLCNPYADFNDIKCEYDLDLLEQTSQVKFDKYKAIILAVAHVNLSI